MLASCNSSATRIDSVWQPASVSASLFLSIAPDRTDSMDDVFAARRPPEWRPLYQRVSSLSGNDVRCRLRGWRPSGAMNGTVHTAASHEEEFAAFTMASGFLSDACPDR